MKTVIEMARSVGATAYTNRHYPERATHTFSVDQLERFAELVRADEREKCEGAAKQAAREAIVFAMDAEREACARVCYELPWKDMDCIPSNLAFAAAIRARSNT